MPFRAAMSEGDARIERRRFELLAGRDHSDHPELALWHGNIGRPVALDLAPPAPPGITRLHVLNWNLAIGRAYLDELVSRLRSKAFGELGTDPSKPLVMLLQEAYRSDPSVPEAAGNRFHGGHVPVGTRRDLIDFANEHNFSLRYAPSMRNGKHRSDRGNAILSNVALGGARAFVLPYIRQRRVVVKAELEGVPWLTFVAAHLDTGGRLPKVRISAFGAGRSAQVQELIRRLHDMPRGNSFIVGADLNTPLGGRDPALRTFRNAGFLRADGSQQTGHTFHGPVKLQLDHVLYHSENGAVRNVTVARLDETAGDRGSRVFGSDHHPLLAEVLLVR